MGRKREGRRGRKIPGGKGFVSPTFPSLISTSHCPRPPLPLPDTPIPSLTQLNCGQVLFHSRREFFKRKTKKAGCQSTQACSQAPTPEGMSVWNSRRAIDRGVAAAQLGQGPDPENNSIRQTTTVIDTNATNTANNAGTTTSSTASTTRDKLTSHSQQLRRGQPHRHHQ